MLLSAVISGSLMTGNSVRYSLKRSSSEKLGNTGIVVNSGMRYFDPSVSERISRHINVMSTGILEMKGYCQNFASGESAFSVNIIGIDQSFFEFHGDGNIMTGEGEVAVNGKLAELLDLNEGDDIMIRFDNISDIPSDAPFAPEKGPGTSMVLKTGKVLSSGQAGNFSLGISQITPLNVFINRADIITEDGKPPAINRLLIEGRRDISVNDVYDALKEVLTPEDIGLKIRLSERTGSYEIISARIFLDESLIEEIKAVLPLAEPVITYMGNQFIAGKNMAPYSFISGLPSTLFADIPHGNGIIINQWLAEDLNAAPGDTIEVRWYSPDIANRLTEESGNFIVSNVAGMDEQVADVFLMPEFPGISGSESCSDWDAGVPIDMKLIRQVDEDYWSRYKGTPKAVISYEKGRELWGSNYGPATSLRFPSTVTEPEIRSAIAGSLDPYRTGFTITDIQTESIRAASQGTDFSTLFLSLGFFIILSSVILLILVISTYLESRRAQIRTFFALGFTDRHIGKMLIYEAGLVAFAGALAGIAAGVLFNLMVIKALNSVWSGAVQTNTLVAGMAFYPVLAGFGATLFITMVITSLRIRSFLKGFKKAETGIYRGYSTRLNLILLLAFSVPAVIFLVISLVSEEFAVPFSFAAGALFFISLILLYRQMVLRRPQIDALGAKRGKNILTALYNSFNPSHTTTPLLFIAAGIFAIMITGVNKMSINDRMLEPSGGTGGYLLWSELAVPVKEDLNSRSGRIEFGLDDEVLSALSFVHARRSQGDDASCLNLNNVAAPPLLGINPCDFIEKGAFSFASRLRSAGRVSPWEMLDTPAGDNVIYGIADQTVMQWGLKIRTGDTLVIRAENGEPLSIVIAGGLKASVFQGYVLTGFRDFNRYFPSVSGSQILLADGDPELTETYREVLESRFINYGIRMETGAERLSSFFGVNNTYLTVFSFLGTIGMVLGIAGLGFIMLRNYSRRRQEFALMMAAGFTSGAIRSMIIRDQLRILVAGIITGAVPALLATLPSLRSGSDVPWLLFVLMMISIFTVGLISLLVAVRRIEAASLISSLRKE
jgi:ABC-type antimicrobial peptide transport system permease subunit